MRKRVLVAAVISIVLYSAVLAGQQWESLNAGPLLGVSGIARIAAPTNPTFLIVHDTKGRKVYTAKVIIVGNKGTYEPLDWENYDLRPHDLEAIAAVPGDDTFIAVASAGNAYRIRILPKDKYKPYERIYVIGEFSFPKSDCTKDIEGFSIKEVADKLLTVWAYRGKDEDGAVICWGDLELSRHKVTVHGSQPFTVAWPTTPNIRHISDLRVDSDGVLFVVAASDPGNDGPFSSALYRAGRFTLNGNNKFDLTTAPVELRRFPNHKVEAIEFLPGSSRMAFGTDDENKGGSISIQDISP